MEIRGERVLAARRTEVWRALNVPAVLQRCLAGCDSFECNGENKYRVTVKLEVRPVSRARRLQLEVPVIAQSIEEDDDFRSISSVGFSCYQGNMAGRPAVWSPA